jgi:hypothetical protein
MPSIVVNDEGAVLSYEDSGAPAGKTDYSTVVILHGLVFHAGMDSCYFYKRCHERI